MKKTQNALKHHLLFDIIQQLMEIGLLISDCYCVYCQVEAEDGRCMDYIADVNSVVTRSSADADNRLDAFSGQSRSTNMVPFHM